MDYLAKMFLAIQIPLVLILAQILLFAEAAGQLKTSALSAAQEEAYYQVDVLLSTETQDDSDKGIFASVKSANELLESTSVDIQNHPSAAESSFSGEIRGETIDLMKKLINLYEMIERKEKKGAIYAISEEIGNNLVNVWQAKNRLIHLEDYLVKLVSLIEEKNDGLEKGWFSRFLEKLGL